MSLIIVFLFQYIFNNGQKTCVLHVAAMSFFATQLMRIIEDKHTKYF